MATSKLRVELSMRIAVAVIVPALSVVFFARAAEKVDFNSEVKPILESTCVSCHAGDKPKGGLRLDTRAAAIQGGEHGAALAPGKPKMSPLYTSTILPPGDDDIMPPKGDPLSKEQTE